jgi:K+-transporting ATPase ATPase C chain
MSKLISEIRIAVSVIVLLGIILCGLYPLVIKEVSGIIFPRLSQGSLVMSKGRITGSKLLAQRFSDMKYFHSRPSAAGSGYDPLASGGSNLGPLSRKLIETVRQNAIDYRRINHLPHSALVPVDAVTASASGLDPHISVENAFLQASRVAQARGVNLEYVKNRIRLHTEERDLGILGEPRVNVLMLNLDLDGIHDGN